MHLLDTLIIAVYMITLVGIGIRVAGRQKTTDSYFVAGRTVPGWAAGLSLLATIITSLTFIAFPGAAYAGDWNLLVPGILLRLRHPLHRPHHRALLPPRSFHVGL